MDLRPSNPWQAAARKGLHLALLSAIVLLNACTAAETPAETAETARATATKALPTASPTVAPTVTNIPQAAFGKIARTHMEYLATEIGTRLAGTEEEQRAADYIAGAFEAIGYEPVIQEFTGTGDLALTGKEISTTNIIAIKPGESQEQIIVGAHYDSTGLGKGADDNASGVGVLLELAELLRDRPTPYTIVFIAFGAEEAGLLGSSEYVRGMTSSEISRSLAMINVDSVAVGDKMYVYSDEGDKAFLRDWAMAWAGKQGFGLLTIENVDLSIDGYGTGDYDAFRTAGIPYFYFEATNWDVGYKDGLAQVNEKFGDGGYIRDTEFDTFEYIETTFPGRTDQHLNMVTSILYQVLTGFELSK